MQYNITYRDKNKGIQYIISYKDEIDGKWKQKSKQGFKGKKEAKAAAEDALDELKKELIEQRDLNKEYKGITFDKFAKMYVEHEKLYREENTIESKEYALKKFSKLNKIEIDKIKNIDIQRCVDVMVKEKLSRVTIKHYLSMIKAMFNSAINEYNIINLNPVNRIKLPEIKKGTEKTALTQSEFENMLSKISDYKLYLITLLAGSCGLRIGEIMGLSWDDMDENELCLHIRQQLKRTGKNTKHDIGTLKSRNSQRDVPITINILAELKKFKAQYPLNIDGRIFNFTNTSSIASRLSALYKSIGYDISVHELRHTYATLLISKGIDFKTVAKLMGHGIEQTMRTYSHVTDEMMEKATMTIRSIF